MSGEAPLPEGKSFMDDNLLSQGETTAGELFNFIQRARYKPSSDHHWKTTKEGIGTTKRNQIGWSAVGNWLTIQKVS